MVTKSIAASAGLDVCTQPLPWLNSVHSHAFPGVRRKEGLPPFLLRVHNDEVGAASQPRTSDGRSTMRSRALNRGHWMLGLLVMAGALASLPSSAHGQGAVAFQPVIGTFPD